MPLISITTSVKINDKTNLLKKSSILLSKLTKKPEKFVMVKLIESVPMYFAGDDSPSCFINIKSIGSLEPSKMAEELCNFIKSEIEIPSNRIYINFDDIDASMWAWEGRTFG